MVEDFLKILDDVHAMRSNMFEFSNLTDRANNKDRKDNVPNYEPLIAKMRIGIRESGYFSEAYVEKNLESMVGEPLNEALTDIFKISVSQRDSDILNVVRHSDLNCGYNQGSKIAVLEKDMNPKQSEKDLIDNLKSEIKIMISASQIGSVVEASNSLYSREGTIYNDSLSHF